MVDFGVQKERAFIFRRRKELCNEIPWCESSRELISNCLVLYIWGLTLLFCSDLVRPKKRIMSQGCWFFSLTVFSTGEAKMPLPIIIETETDLITDLPMG